MKKKKMTNAFADNFRSLTTENIRRLNNSIVNVELNNVLEGFEKECFHISIEDERNLEKYSLIYIGDYGQLKGFTFTTGRSIKQRDLLTFRFAQQIEHEFPEENSLVIFNTFQDMIKKMYERLGILCIAKKFIDNGSKIEIYAPHKNAVDYILEIDILEFYQSFFERIIKVENSNNQDKVYLMYDRIEDKVKIGKTKRKLEIRKKGVSEPTLRASDQFIEIITAWEASGEIETELKSKYTSKRIRGEWFDLRPTELKELNELMEKYKMIEHEPIE